METVLSGLSVGIGAAGAALGLVVGRTKKERPERDDWTAAIFATIVTLILFLLTRLSSEPFSFGGRLGYGILIGGILGALAGIWAVRVTGSSPWSSHIAAAGHASLALFGIGLVLLIFAGYPQPAIGGFIIGALASSVIFRLGVVIGGTDIWAVTAAALGATVLLATLRFGSSADRFWWRAPLMALAVAIIGQIVAAGAARENRSFALPAAIGSAIVLALVAVFAWKLFPNWDLFYVALLGVVTFALVTRLADTAQGSAPAAAVAVLAVIALATVGFRLLGGFGTGMGILAAWPILLTAVGSLWRAEEDERGGPSRTVTYAAFIGIAVLFYRLFLENYAPELRGLDLREHYTFVAIALGAVFPFVLTSLYPISRRSLTCRLRAAAMAGVIAAASPLLLLVLWGFKAELGFVVGTVAASAFILFIQMGAAQTEGPDYRLSAILVLAAQAAAVLLSGLVGPLAQLPRMIKVIILAAAVLLGIIYAVMSAVAARSSGEE